MALYDRNALSSAYGSCITSLSFYIAQYTIKDIPQKKRPFSARCQLATTKDFLISRNF